MRLLNCRAFTGICCTLLLAACTVIPGAPTATTDYDRSYDFSRVQKIAIQPIARDTLSTMMISDAQISRIDKALRAELQRRGFQVVARNADADIFLSWQLLPQESSEVSTFDPARQQIVQGTLYVNMIDPVMLQPVWRASFHSDLHGQLETHAAEQYRQAAAQAVLAQFPPAAAAH